MTAPTTARLTALRTQMVKSDTDLVALGPGSHMQWLLGFHPHADERPCLLLIGKESETFLMPVLNAEGSRECTDISFHNWSDANGPDEALREALKGIDAANTKRMALDETMRADFALLLVDALPSAEYTFTAQTIGELRMRKDSADFALLKENALINDNAMQAGFAAIRPGMTELELAEIIKGEFTARCAKPEFWIVGSGPNGAFPHHQTGDRKLQVGDAIVMDIGGHKDGFFSDMTRMAVIGSASDAPDGFVEVHSIVNQAVEAALAAARPGVKASEVDAAARDVIADAGYGDFFVHRTGHGLGIEVHEPPYISSTSETVLDTGMVFSIEPGIYLPGRFGIRLEEIVYLREDGPEILSDLPRDIHWADV